MMRYQELPPAPELRRHVSEYWSFTVSAEQPGPKPHVVPPDGSVSLVYGRTAYAGVWMVVMGPRPDAFHTTVSSGDCYWGVRFWPGTARSLLHYPVAPLRGVMVSALSYLPEVGPPLFARLSELASIEEAAPVFDSHLLPLVDRAHPLDAEVMLGVGALLLSRGQALIREVAREAGLSERQFLRRFREAVGLTPKELGRVLRARSAAVSVALGDPERLTWGTVAAESGYLDQSHLIHEFSTILGLPPTTFEARMRAIAHVDVRS